MNSHVRRTAHQMGIGVGFGVIVLGCAITFPWPAQANSPRDACPTTGAAEVSAEQPDDRHPIPTAAEQATALGGLKEIFKPYPPQKPEDKVKVAKKLIADNENSPGDLNSQYVQLHEAAELSAAAGDFQAATQAMDSLAKIFAVNTAGEKLALLKRAKSNHFSPAAASTYTDTVLAIGWGAMRKGDFENGNRAAALAATVVREAQDAKLTAASQSLTADARKAMGESGQAKSAEEKLKTKGQDPAANLAAGRFACYWRGDWVRGLPMLAKGSDAALKQIAESDLTPPTDAEAQLTLAGKYSDLAAKETGIPRNHLRERAAYWYTQAEPGLSGLKKVLAQRRIADLAKADPSDATSFTSRELTLARLLNDPSHWIVKTGSWENTPGRFHGEGDAEIDFDTPLPPDIVFSFHINVIKGSRPRMHFEGTGMTFANEGYTNNLYPHGTKAPEAQFDYKNNEPHLLKFTLTGDHFEIAIDGKRAFTGTYKTTPSIHLRFRAGDSWSRGTTEYSAFEVESLPNGMNAK